MYWVVVVRLACLTKCIATFAIWPKAKINANPESTARDISADREARKLAELLATLNGETVKN
jgi:hypothetical protein